MPAEFYVISALVIIILLFVARNSFNNTSRIEQLESEKYLKILREVEQSPRRHGYTLQQILGAAKALGLKDATRESGAAHAIIRYKQRGECSIWQLRNNGVLFHVETVTDHQKTVHVY